MRSAAVIPVVTAILIAIAVSLGTASSSTDPSISSDFKELIYRRSVDHDRPALLGECPLSRIVTVKQGGTVEVEWLIQVVQLHGCDIALDYPLASSPEQRQKTWDEIVVARQIFKLSNADLTRFLGLLDTMEWSSDWTDQPDSLPTRCPAFPTESDPDEYLIVEDVRQRWATLFVFCTANDRHNSKVLDDATKSFAPKLPAQLRVSPSASRLLNP